MDTFIIVNRRDGAIRREFSLSDPGIDTEIEFKNDAGEAAGKNSTSSLSQVDSYERDTGCWMARAFPVMLVIRST